MRAVTGGAVGLKRERGMLAVVEPKARAFLEGLVVGILLATGLRALLSTLFFLSLATLRLNGSATWTVVLAAPALAPLLPRDRRVPLLVAGVATSGLALARFTDAFVPLAALAVAASLLAFARLSPVGLGGALAGIALNGALLLLGDSYDPLMLPPFALASLVLALVAAALARAGPDAAQAPVAWSAGIAWALLLAAEVAFLGSPFAVARNTAATAPLAAFAGLAGLVLGATFHARAGPWLLVVGALALVDLLLLHTPLAPLSLALAQAAVGATAMRLPRPHGVALGPAFAALMFGLLFFGQPMGDLEWTLALPLLVLLPMALALRARAPAHAPRRATLPLVGVALLLATPSLLAAPPAPERESPDGAFTVVSWNVRQGFGNRGALDPMLYAEVLRALDPDVVILQEADTARLSSGGLDIRRYLGDALQLRAANAGTGIAVLSRYGIAEGGAPREDGWSLQVPLDVEGQTVWVQGIHLARSREERAQQAESILAAAAAEAGPRVLAGDLNSCPTDTCFGGRASDGIHDTLERGFNDTWSALHDPTDPAGNTHPSWDPRRRIDVIMVRGLDVLDAGPFADERTPLGSDHLPLVARLSLRDG